MDQTSETEKALQRAKYNEIVEILLGAGYFRARINTLSEFDKVVGGLCWCITSSGESVDVDILFQENSTIGQKIALSEAVVTALRKMGCPSPLQPHQIQGGVGGADYPAILLVIVWLVKKYFERRVEREQQLRSYSIFQFGKNYEFPNEIAATTVSPTLAKILDRSKPNRLFKRRVRRSEPEETRVRSCLLEFGESFAKLGGGSGGAGGTSGGDGSSSGANASVGGNRKSTGKGGSASAAGSGGSATGADSAAGDERFARLPVIDAVDLALADLSKFDMNELSGFEKQLAKAAREAKKDEIAFAEKASREESEIMQQMLTIDESKIGAISGSQVGNIVGLSADEISSASAAYQAEMEHSKKLLDENVASGRLGTAAAYTRQLQNLTKQKEEILASQVAQQIKTDALKQRLSILNEEKSNALEYLEQLRSQVQKLTDLEANSTQKQELATIKRLIALNESLKVKETDFKSVCKTKRSELLAKIKALDEEENDENNAPERKQHREIQEMHAKVLSKYNRLRQMLAEVNLEVASSVRIIDDTPTRTELIQYERRFVELYQQVAWKLEETRKYYDIYNTLDSTLSFLQKEIKLLNSISENFADAMRSATNKMEFSKQFDMIVKGVEESLKRQDMNLGLKQQRVENHKQIYQQLVEEQRRYYKAVKDFQDECNKNEWLMAKMEEIKHK